MNTRLQYFIVALLGVTLVGWAIRERTRPREPAYRGRPVSWWLDQAIARHQWPHSTIPENLQSEVTNAFRAMGARAVPYIVARLKKERSPLRVYYYGIWIRAGSWKKILPAPGPWLFSVSPRLLESIGSSDLQCLVSLLRSESAELRSHAASALENLQLAGYDIHRVIPALEAALKDPSILVRTAAAYTLGRCGPSASNAVPALTSWLYVRQGKAAPVVLRTAADALGNIGPASRGAAPLLTNLLTYSDSFVRIRSARALWRIDRQTNAVLGVLLDALPRSEDSTPQADFGIQREALDALAEMGPAAKPAVPILLQATRRRQSEYPHTRLNACAALLNVEPSLAQKVVPTLADVLDDHYAQPDELQTAARLLGTIGPPAEGAVFALWRLQKHSDTNVSHEATLALRLIFPAGAGGEKN